MRLPSFSIAACMVILTGVASYGGDELAKAVRQYKIIEKPEAFRTLVNPNCSHCVDESKRRAGQLQKKERVLAWIRGKYEGGAIPVRFFLAPYRVISDTYGVFVFDPEAGFMRGFEPSLDFRFHGWRNGIMVIRHKDGTLYSALSGKAFDGPRKGDQLKPVATLETQWGDWLDRYPDTVAYHMFEKYQPVDIPNDDGAESIATRGPADPRLPPKSEVLGVAIDGNVRAYPLAALEESNGLIVDTFAGQKVYILWYKPTRTAAAFAAQIDHSGSEPQAQEQVVTLTANAKASETPFTDSETSSQWDIAGRAISGELKGKTLRWLPGVQCRWFAWAAEYPETEVYKRGAAKRDPAGEQGAAVTDQPQEKQTTATDKSPKSVKPLEAVIVEAAAVTPEKTAAWAKAGQHAIVVVLDEETDPEAYRAVAQTVSRAGLDLYYWIEVARNKKLADAHPRWMASLGMHDDWQKRFPETRAPVKDLEVAKAYPWVPIGYSEGFEAHRLRVEELLKRATEPYRGLLLNDLQAGPAACGCGNLQCRWALDYGVPATATKLPGHDVAVRFLAEVRTLVPEKVVIPVWMTECEHSDLSAKLRAGAPTTGLCGSVPCSTGTCPKIFAKQWAPLVADRNTAIGLLVLQNELARSGPLYAASPWVANAVEYVDTIPASLGEKTLPHDRLWLVLQGYDINDADQAAARKAARETHPAAILTALTRLDQSFEPRVISIKEKLKN